MQAEIITIGDEILIGQVVDTNSAWLAARLNEAGIAVTQITSIGDDAGVLKQSLDRAAARADVILMTGGLGPTRDDRTKLALCEYFGAGLRLDEASLENVHKIFERTGRPLLEVNVKQAEVPDCCTVLQNKLGTAPGMWFEKEGKVYVSLPGVPYEMMELAGTEVIPRLKAYFGGRLGDIVHKTLVTVGIGESFLAEKIREVEDSLPPHIRLAYLPRPGMVRLRLSAAGRTRHDIEKELEPYTAAIRKQVGDYLIAEEDLSPAELLLSRLQALGKSVATAESCTGGYIAHLLTAIPGASAAFKGGVVAYSNEMKIALLGVQEGTIAEFGAVSRETVSEMARGAVERLGTDYALACSGIAGPDGGTEAKPVGTVWIALAGEGVAGEEKVHAEKFVFPGKRMQVIERTALAAMTLLLRQIGRDRQE